MQSRTSLVTTQWLKQNLSSVKIIDSSWHMPALKRNARAEFVEKHIPVSLNRNSLYKGVRLL
jgi:3-mercaptopyruvate sulfurtransferase SseA